MPGQNSHASESSNQKHLSPEAISRAGPARRMMEALSQNREISISELLGIIGSVKTDALINQAAPQQPQISGLEPSVETELNGLLRQMQAIIAARRFEQPEEMGRPIQRLVSQQSRPSPVDAVEPVKTTAAARYNMSESLNWLIDWLIDWTLLLLF